MYYHDLLLNRDVEDIYQRSDLKTAGTLADYLCVSARTVHHWRRTNKIPPWAIKLLAQRHGNLGAFNDKWRGWRLWEDQLWSPNDQPIGQTAIAMNHQFGSLVERANMKTMQAQEKVREAEAKLLYVTQSLAGFMAAMQKPRIDQTFTVYTEDGRPIQLTAQP